MELVVYKISTLKKMLWDAYLQYFENNKRAKILYILKKQGKTDLIKNKVYNEELEELIKSEGYFITTMDLWVFAQTYKIPIVLFSSNRFLHDMSITNEPGSDHSWVVLGYNNGVDRDDFFFYESVSSHKISKNVLINRTFNVNQLNGFKEEFVRDFDKKTVFINDLLKLVHYIYERPKTAFRRCFKFKLSCT